MMMYTISPAPRLLGLIGVCLHWSVSADASSWQAREAIAWSTAHAKTELCPDPAALAVLDLWLLQPSKATAPLAIAE